MNNLQKLTTPIEIYNFQSKQLRVVGTYEDPWFAAKDICDILGIVNTHNSLINIPDKWKGVCKINTPSGIQEMSVVNEAGLYKQILRSNKPAAVPFQEWVCEDVLTSLRKKGEYVLQEYKEKLEKQQELLDEKESKTIEQKNRIKQLENKILKKQSRVQYEKNVVYMIQDKYHKQDKIYIIGRSENLTDRLTSYNKDRDHEVIYYKACNSIDQMILIEKCILYRLDKYREVSNRDRFVLPNNENISLFTDAFDQIINYFKDVDSSVSIKEDEVDEELLELKKSLQEDLSRVNSQIYLQKHKRDLISKKPEILAYQEELNEKSREYYKENKKAVSDQKKEYYLENKEEISLKKKIYKEENKEVIAKKNKNWRENNKEKTDNSYLKRKEKVECECGLHIARYCLTRHRNSAIHQSFLNKKINNTENSENSENSTQV
jgi:prophage antirepressor-like protein